MDPDESGEGDAVVAKQLQYPFCRPAEDIHKRDGQVLIGGLSVAVPG